MPGVILFLMMLVTAPNPCRQLYQDRSAASFPDVLTNIGGISICLLIFSSSRSSLLQVDWQNRGVARSGDAVIVSSDRLRGESDFSGEE